MQKVQAGNSEQLESDGTTLPKSFASPETKRWGEAPPRLAHCPGSMAAEAAASTPALKMASPPLGVWAFTTAPLSAQVWRKDTSAEVE